MTELQKQQLYDRNNKIIEIVLNQIKKECPNSVDMIGIGGSFCSGDIYENSDLDLVIIENDAKAGILCKCFILGNVGFDIYTQGWNRFEETAKYNHPYVTKLFDLDIIYTRDDSVKERYEKLREIAIKNMNDIDNISMQVSNHFIELLRTYRILGTSDNLSESYKCLAKILKEVEFIIYMINKTYIKKGTKRVPEEISNMNILPDNFMEIYNKVPLCSTIDEIKDISSSLIAKIKQLLEEQNITYNIEDIVTLHKEQSKEQISSDALTGTYEEIYSNYKNKIYHATKTNNAYLSFVTMAACQEFYDDMSSSYNIPSIDLIGHYNSSNLLANQIAFDNALLRWKQLYDTFNKEIVKFDNLEDLNNLYKKHI